MRNHAGHWAAIFLAVLSASVTTVSAQVFVPLHTFSTAYLFSAPLAQGSDGTLYGVSSMGGLANYGTVFKLQPDGTRFAIIYSFTNGADGSGPVAGLVVSGNTLYGTAKSGGSGGHGTLFKINTDGSGFVPIYTFSPYVGIATNADGINPVGALVLAGGVLCGTASAGGHGYGTVFKVNTDGSDFTTLYNFSGVVRSIDGAYPMAGLILSGDTLYGTTQEGGTNSYGTVFKIDTSGANYATLHAFSATSSGTNSDGDYPIASLVLSGNTLYGTASGGAKLYGSVFAVGVDGSGFTNLYNFTNGVDGSTPQAALVISGDTLYGTTASGGNFPGLGTVFKLGTDGGGFTNLYDFGESADGAKPNAALLLSGGALYGTTTGSGRGTSGGSVFKINTDGTELTVLTHGSDGAGPAGGVASSGETVWGTTFGGGTFDSGTVYQVNTNGTGFATLHAFSATSNNVALGALTNAEGAGPMGTLVLGDGTLYGTANGGGDFGFGTIYRLNTDGSPFTNLYNFANGSDGANPRAGLVLDGSTLYGTAGTVIFKINTDGSGFSNLYNFSPINGGTNSDGSGPLSALTLSGGVLYGAAYSAGPTGGGTIFRINTNGAGFSNVFNFIALIGLDTTNSVDGANPRGDLIISGETIYGTAFDGGLVYSKEGSGFGAIFKVNTDGSGFAPIFTFPAGGFDGSAPAAGMALSGGTLFGTTAKDGNGTAGTVFQVNTNGSMFTPLHTFAFGGGTPLGNLVLAGETLYGTSEFSVPGAGTVFSLTPSGPPSIQFSASVTNGPPPLTVVFSAPPTDDRGNTIIQYYWNFGDGSASSGTPVTHNYVTNRIFTPTLIATNINGAVMTGTGPSIDVAFPPSIQNNGFETGTFTNWKSGGSASQTIATATNYVHSGKYGAQLRAIGSLGFLSQTISTTPGAAYTVSFWLDSFVNRMPNEFQVSWNGAILLDLTNIGATGWTNIQISVTAATNQVVLQFGYLNNLSYFGLDDVSVSTGASGGSHPAFASASLAGASLVLSCGGGQSGHTYFVLMSTNLTTPITQWIPVATNFAGADGNFSVTATNAVDGSASQRYYILESQ